MFSYLCPACGKKHTSSGPFAAPFPRQCLRCGVAFQVTEDIITTAPPPAASAPPSPPSEAITPAPDGPGSPPLAASVAAAVNGNGQAHTQQPLPAPANGSMVFAPSPVIKPAPAAPKTKQQSMQEAMEALDEDDLQLRAEEQEQEPAPEGKKAKKKGKKGKANDQGGEEDAANTDAGTAKPWRPPYLVIGAALAVLLAIGGGAYLFMGKGTPQQQAKAPTPKPKPSQSPPAPTPGAGGKAQAPPPAKDATQGGKKEGKGPTKEVKELPTPALGVAAPTLSWELARDREATNKKYAGKVLLLSGLYHNVELLAKQKKVRVIFQVKDVPVKCELLAPQLAPPPVGALISVLGKYSRDGLLVEGTALGEGRAAASIRHQDKDVELTGLVAATTPARGNKHPTLIMAGDVLTRGSVSCNFPFEAEEALKKLPRDVPITVSGRCGRRELSGGRFTVEIHDCKVVFSTGPVGDARRYDVRAFLRDYQMDLTADYIPPFGKEEVVSEPVTPLELAKEYAGHRANMERKYLYAWVTAKGKAIRISPRSVVLDTGLTSVVYMVSCEFEGDSPTPNKDMLYKELTIRGLCTKAGGEFSLVYCKDVGAKAAPVQRLTEDYLPHKKGRVLTYDNLQSPPGPARKATTRALTRYKWFEKEGGRTEVIVTHALTTKTVTSLFNPAHNGDWLRPAGKKVDWVKSRAVREGTGALAAVFLRKLNGLFIELGQEPPRAAGGREPPPPLMLPVIKVTAKAGDVWESKGADKTITHVFKLERFEDYKGKPCAVITETIKKEFQVTGEIVIEHKFAKGVGEVERRITQDRQLLQEWLLIDLDVGTGAP